MYSQPLLIFERICVQKSFTQKCSSFAGICVAQSLKISRLATNDEFDKIITELLSIHKARAVVMFVNEDNCRNLLATLKRLNLTTELTFLASDSWGAKIHPVYGQEILAEGTVSLLPKRMVIKGKNFRIPFLQK